MESSLYRVGDLCGVRYSAERREDKLIRAEVEAPEGNREQLLTSWESADKWINREITNILTGGRYEIK